MDEHQIGKDEIKAAARAFTPLAVPAIEMKHNGNDLICTIITNAVPGYDAVNLFVLVQEITDKVIKTRQDIAMGNTYDEVANSILVVRKEAVENEGVEPLPKESYNGHIKLKALPADREGTDYSAIFEYRRFEGNDIEPGARIGAGITLYGKQVNMFKKMLLSHPHRFNQVVGGVYDSTINSLNTLYASLNYILSAE